MFKLFKSKKTKEPLNLELRKYFENNLLWLDREFGRNMETRKVLVPEAEDFPVDWNGTEKAALQVTEIIARHMDIDRDSLELSFYDPEMQAMDTGGSRLFIEHSETAAGLYHHKNKNGKYKISLNRKQLNVPDLLIAVIAHELAHVKLLGEKQLADNDEILTDLATVYFGFGIFNANASFVFHKSADQWGWQRIGYMSEEEWAYALALRSFAINENDLRWTNYLSPSLQKLFNQSMEYMLKNENEIFRFDDEI